MWPLKDKIMTHEDYLRNANYWVEFFKLALPLILITAATYFVWRAE